MAFKHFRKIALLTLILISTDIKGCGQSSKEWDNYSEKVRFEQTNSGSFSTLFGTKYIDGNNILWVYRKDGYSLKYEDSKQDSLVDKLTIINPEKQEVILSRSCLGVLEISKKIDSTYVFYVRQVQEYNKKSLSKAE
jgi:hypothetical protein